MAEELHPAELAAMEADAASSRASAAKAEAEARKILADAERAELELAKAQRAEAAELASDGANHVYRFNGQVSTSSVQACVAKLTEWHRLSPGCDVEVIFSSPGGSVIDGFVLFDFLRSLSHRGHHITTGVAGMAASMAGILLQAGDTRWVGAESWVMIHRAAFGASGKTYEIEDEVEWVRRIEKRILDIFVCRSGGKLSAAKVKRNWDRKDWWLSSDEALALGVVDEVR
jgi:ATP-dependent Clp endopeptidase proteolytic subunit ClpP